MSRKGSKSSREEPSGNHLVVEGILEVGTSAGEKSKKNWKKRLICVCQMKGSGQGKLEVYANIKTRPQFQTPSGVILLTPGLRVYIPSESAHPNVFVVEGPDTIIYLAASSQEEQASWMNAIQGLEYFREGNLNPNGKSFTVKAIESEDMTLIGCSNTDCILAIGKDEIQLANLRNHKFIVRWPLHCVRRYVCEMDEFKIYTGRRSPRGVGEYTFHSAQAGEIYSTLVKLIDMKAEELQQTNKLDSLENRPPAPLPTPAVSLPAQADAEQLDGSVKYHEITSDLVPRATHPNPSEESDGYSRTRHDLGEQFNQPAEGGAVLVGSGLYNTLQHMDGEKSKTWRSASIDSKAVYEMAKHPPSKTGAEPIYNVAYPPTTDPKEIPKTTSTATAAQAAQLSPDSHSAVNPAYQSLGDVVEEPKQPQPPASSSPKEYKSSLLNREEKKQKQRSYSMVKKDRVKEPENDKPHRPSYLVSTDSDLDDEVGSPPTIPERRPYTKSECAELDLSPSTSPTMPTPRMYTTSECDELILSASPPEVPPRSYTNASTLNGN